MLIIDIRNVDKLNRLVMDLSALTCLESALNDEEYTQYNLDDFDFVLTYSRSALYDKLKNTVLELKALIQEENFTQPLSNIINSP